MVTRMSTSDHSRACAQCQLCRTAAAEKSRRVRSFLVASDLSDEARYAVEWAIGTVLRDGDSAIFVTVIETDTKRTFALRSVIGIC